LRDRLVAIVRMAVAEVGSLRRLARNSRSGRVRRVRFLVSAPPAEVCRERVIVLGVPAAHDLSGSSEVGGARTARVCGTAPYDRRDRVAFHGCLRSVRALASSLRRCYDPLPGSLAHRRRPSSIRALPAVLIDAEHIDYSLDLVFRALPPERRGAVFLLSSPRTADSACRWFLLPCDGGLPAIAGFVSHDCQLHTTAGLPKMSRLKVAERTSENRPATSRPLAVIATLTVGNRDHQPGKRLPRRAGGVSAGSNVLGGCACVASNWRCAHS
jgi:hypothetical protein